MINYKVRVNNLIRKYNTRNPYTLCKRLNINIIENYYGMNMPKALFKKFLRRKFIIINLTRIENDSEKLFSICHELGHALLHSSDSAFYLHDHTFCVRGRYENEANRFAAELMINENMLCNDQMHSMTLEQLSVYYGVPQELINYKFSLK